MKLKKFLAAVIMLIALVSMVVIPVNATNVAFSAGSVSASGNVTFALTITDATNKVGSIDVDISATGGTITGVTASVGSYIWSGSHLSNAVATTPDSVTVYVACKITGSTMTVNYSNLTAGDGTGDNELPISSGLTSGSATARMPATTTAPTAAPTTPHNNNVATTAPKVTTTASTAANLKALSVKGYTLSPNFSANRTSYTVKVPKDLTSLDVTATPANSNAKVTISGDKNFTAGKSNTVKVLVKGADGTTKTYTVRTVFEEESTTAAAKTVNLDSLTVKAASDVSRSFDPNVYDYNITVPKGTTSLDVSALTADAEDAKVEVIGADNLAAAGNVVTITVTSSDGTVTTYTINVSYENDQMPTVKEERKGAPIWLLIILIILFFVIGFIIGFIIGKKKGSNDDDDDDDPIGPVFGGSDDLAESADDKTDTASSPYAGLNFTSNNVAFNPPIMGGYVEPDLAEPEPEKPSLNQPVYTVAPETPTATQPNYTAAPAYTPAAPAYTSAPAPTYSNPVAPTIPVANANMAQEPSVGTPVYAAPTPAAVPVAPEASIPAAAPSTPTEPEFVAPTLPYQPGAVLTDETIVRPAPKPILRSPFEQCADD